jgi:diadenosine tetraphosphatase ApaH/serine/threonine PP2A family protein phosphatase
MLLAFISDIHSNLQALEAVLAYADDEGVEEFYCLGDIVGYGADPNACLALVRERCNGIVLGNHDQAVVHESYRANLPRDGRKAARHNNTALSEEELAFLAGLPLKEAAHGCAYVHATPRNPDHWIRLTSFQLAQNQFAAFDEDLCLVGHTHRPTVFSDRLGVHQVRPGHRFIVNVGSVGQPRDGDPRACIGLLETQSWSFRLERVEYDVEAAVARIREEHLPKRLGERLLTGQ